MSRRRFDLCLTAGAAALVLLPLGACEEEAPVPVLEPGGGITRDGGSVRIGATVAELEAELGALGPTHDLGAAGRHFAYDDAHVAGLLSGVGTSGLVSTLYIAAAAGGRTPDGLGFGSSREEVEAVHGDPERDGFFGAWMYPEAGIGFEWEDDHVVRVVIFAASP